MKILSYNPGHDGAFAYVEDGRLVFSIEAEKDSKFRHSSLSVPDAFDMLAELQTVPDVLCRGGWWPDSPLGQEAFAGYHGSHRDQVATSKKRLLGKSVDFFSSSHERSHILCAFGMSNLPKGTPCYALLWEGVIGAFYEIDAELNVTKVGDVMPEPGHRYAMLYALADPTFDKSTAEFSRLSDAGKLMALASFSKRSQPSEEEERIISFLLQDCQHLRPSQCEVLMKACPGVRLRSTSAPMARSRTRATKSRITGRATSASISARRTSRTASSMFSSVSRPRPRT